MNSKLEVRFEAAKLAVMVEGVNPSNVVDVAKEIEIYILSGVDLPETYDMNAIIKESMSMLNRNFEDNEKRNEERQDKIDGIIEQSTRNDG